VADTDDLAEKIAREHPRVLHMLDGEPRQICSGCRETDRYHTLHVAQVAVEAARSSGPYRADPPPSSDRPADTYDVLDADGDAVVTSVTRETAEQVAAALNAVASVRPGREEVARALFAADPAHRYDASVWERLRAVAPDLASQYLAWVDAILALLPGRTEAEVKAETLREAADDSEAVRQNADVAECAGHVPGETGRQAAVDAADSMHEEPWAWMRARADQIEKEADRG